MFEALLAITSLGDPGFVLAASGGLALLLLAMGDRRTASALALAVAVSAAVTAAAKILFMASDLSWVHSPSGHAASATTFFLCFGALVAARRPARAAAVLCVISALLVAASRVVLGVHSLGEAVLGVAIGVCAFAVFRRLAAPRPALGQAPAAICLAAALGLHALIGDRIGFEEPLEHVAAILRGLQR